MLPCSLLSGLRARCGGLGSSVLISIILMRSGFIHTPTVLRSNFLCYNAFRPRPITPPSCGLSPFTCMYSSRSVSSLAQATCRTTSASMIRIPLLLV